MPKDLSEIGTVQAEHTRQLETLQEEIEEFRKKLYDTKIELRQAEMKHELDSITKNIEIVTSSIALLQESNRKQEKIMYIGMGVLIATEFIGSNSGLGKLLNTALGGG